MKTFTNITTKLDGDQIVEWWSKDEFCDRNIYIFGDNEVQQISIPDETIICDFCNATIEDFPVPVFMNHALCKKCYEEIKL